MSLHKKLDNLSDIVTGVLVTTIVGHVLSFIKPDHKQNHKHAKKHAKKHKKHKQEVVSSDNCFKEALPVLLGTTAVVRGIKEGNKCNVFASALFTVIAFKLFAFKHNRG